MTTVPGDLIWQIVRKNNSFMVKQFGNGNAKVQFTKEPNNLYNLHSYKYSGLANKKTVTIQPSGGKDTAVVLSTTKTKKQNAPAKLNHKTVMRKDFLKMAKAVKNQDEKEFLDHIIKSTNMKCLTPPSALDGECGFLAANLYAKSVFGEDALVNISVEKQTDGKLSGYIRIRSKTQGIALSLGDKITLRW